MPPVHRALKDWRRPWLGSTGQPKAKVLLLPGWAVKQPPTGTGKSAQLHITLAGFAAETRSLSAASRTQRFIIKLFSRFAAPLNYISPGFDAFEDDIDDDRPLRPPPSSRSTSYNGPGASVSNISVRLPGTESKSPDAEFEAISHGAADHGSPAGIMHRRLKPFWSRPLIGQSVVIKILQVSTAAEPDAPIEDDSESQLLQEFVVITDLRGHFARQTSVDWTEIAHNLTGFKGIDSAQDENMTSRILVRAELLQSSHDSTPSSSRSRSSSPEPSLSDLQNTLRTRSVLREPEIEDPKKEGVVGVEPELRSSGDEAIPDGICVAEAELSMSIESATGVRVISDLDDTIKYSNIKGGPQEVFRNVFSRPIHQLCIPGMDTLYRSMSAAGVDGFHFISNSPYQLLPAIHEFLTFHQFPSFYSLRLKYYGGLSIISSLLQPAAERKRPALAEAFAAFPQANFILIGDNGEEDLELYLSVARMYERQVKAIFIRDVISENAEDTMATATVPLPPGSDPPATGGFRRRTRNVLSSLSALASVGSNAVRESLGNASETARILQQLQAVTLMEEKALRRSAQWEVTVARCREELPPGVELVIFTKAEEIMDRATELARIYK